jgi:hypothetical protein
MGGSSQDGGWNHGGSGQPPGPPGRVEKPLEKLKKNQKKNALGLAYMAVFS